MTLAFAPPVARGPAHVARALELAGPVDRDAGAEAPAAPAYLTTLLIGVDDLPIVVRDLPDAGSRAAVEAYLQATVLRPEPLVDMFVESWGSLVLPPEAGAEQAIEELRRRIADQPEESIDAIDPAVARDALAALAVDARNADRLNNAAVALWLFGVTGDLDPETQPDVGGYAEYVQQAAVHLLEITNEAFPRNRAVLLNLAFLHGVLPVSPDRGFGGAAFARQVLDDDPVDLTARLLVASLQSRNARESNGAEEAERTLAPLLVEQGLAALGHAALGDAHLAAATIRRPEAPAESRRHARIALAEYDAATGATDDAGLLAGRALALEAVDDLGGAIDAQRRAVALAPASLDLRIGLARLQELAGNVDELRAAADAALELVRARWDPPIAGLRFVTDPYGFAVRGDYGFLGWSVGSERGHLPVKQTPQGGGIVLVGRFPRTNEPALDHGLRALAGPWAAARLALHAAIDDGRLEEASAVRATWDRVLPWSSRWMDEFAGAAALVADGQLPLSDAADPLAAGSALGAAETSLRRAGRFDQAADLCRVVASGSVDPVIETQAWRCAGESAFLAGDLAGAAQHLDRALEASGESGNAAFGRTRADPLLRLLAAQAAEAAGDRIGAERLFRETVADDSSEGARIRLMAALNLGDLELAAGDAVAATGEYELALAMIAVNGLDEPADYWESTAALEVRGLEQVARNNHGIALLHSLERAPDGAPECDAAGSTVNARARCQEALAEFRAAVASDPGNAVYRLNEGWASRLLGDEAGARTALKSAAGLDATLFPAFNDLGVFLAERGDRTGASSAFEAALAAAPDYDLARWNLGVLRLRAMPPDLLGGQASLAQAIRANPDLARAPLDFHLDERTYQFGFDLPPGAPTGEPVGRTHSVGAAVLAAAASVTAFAQLQASVLGKSLKAATVSAADSLERLLQRLGWRARLRRLRRRLPGAVVRTTLPWLLTAPLLVLVTIWQATQASPGVASAAVLLALVATALALVVHELGHLGAARFLGGRLIPAYWGPGVAVSVALLPFQAAGGPFLAERVHVMRGGRERAWVFHLAGPLANAALAAVAYLLFLAEPLPFLRLLSQVQLAVIAFTLLPMRPLDGFALNAARPRLFLVAGLAAFAASAAFALGVL